MEAQARVVAISQWAVSAGRWHSRCYGVFRRASSLSEERLLHAVLRPLAAFFVCLLLQFERKRLRNPAIIATCLPVSSMELPACVAAPANGCIARP